MHVLNAKKGLLAAAAAALTVGGALVGVAAPGGASTSGAYLRTTTASTTLSSTGAEVGLLSVSIPAGTWTVTAKANPVNFGNADYVRCRIMVNGKQKDASATLVGNAGPAPTGELGPSVAQLFMQTAFTASANSTVALKCQHDFAYAGEYVDPGASIMVVKAPGPLG